jgi:hypothetical protein
MSWISNTASTYTLYTNLGQNVSKTMPGNILVAILAHNYPFKAKKTLHFRDKFPIVLLPVFRIHASDKWIRILEPNPAIFVTDLQDASKKQIFNTIFSAYYFLKVHLHHFSKIKSKKKSQNSRNQCFSYYFCMVIEGSGSIPLTSGSGSGRPKNMWIRIRNTDYFSLQVQCTIFVCLIST